MSDKDLKKPRQGTPGYNKLTEPKEEPKSLQGFFWSSVCFECPHNKKNEALNTFINKSSQLDENEQIDLRSCKVCVKYAMALTEVRKQIPNLDRFFNIDK